MQFLFCKNTLKSIGAKLLFWWFLLGGIHLIDKIVLLTGIGFWIMALDIIIIFTVLIGGISIIINMLRCLFKNHRQNAFHHLIALIIAILLVPPTLWAAWQIRMQAFYLAGQRSAPIIQAVAKYYEAHENVPKNLQILVPEYIDSIPANIPPYRLYKSKEGWWCITAPTSSGIINFDEFIYCSDRTFTENIRDPYTQLGDWVYIHE